MDCCLKPTAATWLALLWFLVPLETLAGGINEKFPSEFAWKLNALDDNKPTAGETSVDRPSFTLLLLKIYNKAELPPLGRRKLSFRN